MVSAIKRLLFYIATMVCVGGAAWADISGKLDSLRVMVYEQSLVPAAGTDVATDATTNRIVNRAIQKVCVDFPAIEKLDTIVSTVGGVSYALNTDYHRLSNVIKMTKDGTSELKIIYSLSFPPMETWFEAKGGEVGGQTDPNKKPNPRYASEFNDRLFLYPTPSLADSFIVTYYAIDRQLTGGDSTTNVIPEYREAVVWYGAFLLAVRRGDYDRAVFCKQTYLEIVAEEKSKGVPDKK